MKVFNCIIFTDQTILWNSPHNIEGTCYLIISLYKVYEISGRGQCKSPGRKNWPTLTHIRFRPGVLCALESKIPFIV